MMDFLTVCYLPELSLLRLQARSLRIFYKGPCRLRVVWNTLDTAEIPRWVEPMIAAELTGSEVQWVIHPAEHFVGAEILKGSVGRRSQQILKLLAAREMSELVYCVLDSKNHLIRPLEECDLVRSGRPISHPQSYADSGFLPLLHGAREFMGLDSIDVLRAMPTTTPYVMISAEVRELLDHIEAKSGTTAGEAFLRSPELHSTTEFLLYYAHLVKKHSDVSKIYDFERGMYATIFRTGPRTPEGMRRTLASFGDPRIKFFGLHAQRIPIMSAEDISAVFEGWRQAGLVKDFGEAKALFPAAAVDA